MGGGESREQLEQTMSSIDMTCPLPVGSTRDQVQVQTFIGALVDGNDWTCIQVTCCHCTYSVCSFISKCPYLFDSHGKPWLSGYADKVKETREFNKMLIKRMVIWGESDGERKIVGVAPLGRILLLGA